MPDLLTGALGVLYRLAFRSRRAPAVAPLDRPPPRRPPTPSAILAAERRYGTWAFEAELRRDPTSRGLRGSLVGVPVLVRTGLEGSAPSSVELEVTIEHEEQRWTLLRRGEALAASSGPVPAALATLFTDPDAQLAAALKTISVLPGEVHLRLAPLTDPAIVQRAAARLVDLLRELRMPAATQPYR